MNKKEIKRLGLVFALCFLMALAVDITEKNLQSDGSIKRDVVGGEEKNVSLELNVDGLLEKYPMELEIMPTQITKEEAEQYFSEAIQEIDAAFKEVDGEVPLEEQYISDLVEAEWSFSPTGYITSDGEVVQAEIPDDGIMINAKVSLQCGQYEEVYAFPFFIEKVKLSKKETLLMQINKSIEWQMQQEGTSYIELPEEIDGINISWTEKKEYFAVKILFLELVAVILIFYVKKKEKENIAAKRKKEIEMEYADFVNQLSILVEAGMTIRQAWQRMAIQYSKRRKMDNGKENIVYEAILRMSRQLSEGENEKLVYERFAKEMDVLCYRRLIRMLTSNLEKGSGSLKNYLEEESKKAYDQRILLAKKLGEEASTKLLGPLMLMMMLIMAVVIAPALISFSI